MKCIVAASVAMMAVGSVHGMGILARAVQLPTKEILEKRINTVILPVDFDRITKLSQHLATSASVGDLLCKVGASLYIYNNAIECVKGLSVGDKNLLIKYIDGQRSNLIKAVLQDNTALLAELKEKNLL